MTEQKFLLALEDHSSTYKMKQRSRHPKNHSCSMCIALRIDVYLLLCFEGLKASTIVEKT